MLIWIVFGLAVVAGGVGLGAVHRRLARTEARLRRTGQALESLRISVRGHLAAERERSVTRTGGVSPRFHSPYAEDLFLWDLFEGRACGTFIEVGAYDGLHLSVSAVFEAAGWRGVLIEPQPEQAARCRSNRPGSVVIEAALAGPEDVGEARFTALPDLARSTSAAESPVSFLETTSTHRRRRRRAMQSARTITVRVRTMDDVLSEAGLAGSFDFAVIDVEGGEAGVLRGFDLAKTRVRVIVIEIVEDGDAGAAEVHRRLDEGGYVRIDRLGENVVYIHAEEPALIERARLLRLR